MLMGEIYCARSEFDHGDPKTVYHVRGSAIQELPNEYNVNNLYDLDAANSMLKPIIWSTFGPVGDGIIVIQSKLVKNAEPVSKNAKEPKSTVLLTEKHATAFLPTMLVTLSSAEPKKKTTNQISAMIFKLALIQQSVTDGWTGANGHHARTHVALMERKKRTRRCGTCSNPDENGLCTNPTEAFHAFTDEDHALFCPLAGQSETASCTFGKCLPRSNGLPNSNQKQYLVLRGWQTY